MKKFSILLIVVLISLAAYNYPNTSKTINIASGFSAKNLCSGYFISGFDAQMITDEALTPIDPAFGLVDHDFDLTNKTVTTHVLGGFERKAIYREGLGCTLLVSGQDDLSTKVKPISFIKQSTSTPWPDGLGAAINDPSVNYQLLNQAIELAFNESEVSGKRHVKAIAVIYNGQLIAERYSEDVDLNTPLLSWSMAKSITGLQVGLLVKQGLVDILKPADVPAWSSDDDPRSKITLDQLMRMSSGLEFNETYGIISDVSSMLSIEGDSAAFAANKPLEHPVDSFWAYSSGTTNIISGIIKRTLGGDLQSYYEYTQKNLFIPLAINSAISETDASDTFVGSSYFYATARDWAKLGQLLLQAGQWKGEQILPENWVNYSSTATKTIPLNNYGAQFWLNKNPNDPSLERNWPTAPDDIFYMGGYQGQYVIVAPSQQLVIVRFGFTNPGTNRGVEKLIRDTIAALPKS